MKLSDLVNMSLSSLWRRKARTILTTLGVVIGSSAILLMISIGIGYEESFKKDLEMFGNIRIINIEKPYSNPDDSNKKSVKFNEDMIKKLKNIDGVDDVMGIYTASIQLTLRRYEAGLQVMGVDFTKLEKFQYNVSEGQVPKKGELALIAGKEVSNFFYNPSARRYEQINVDLLNNTFKFYVNSKVDSKGNAKRPKRISVSGILEGSGGISYSVFMDRDVLTKLLKEDKRRYGDNKKKSGRSDTEYNKIQIICKDINDVEKVTDIIKEMGVSVDSPIEYVKQQKKQMEMQQALLGAIGFVSLLVAAIGITNTMIMSIYERTREIGVMKVLGAEVGDIMKMFLVEAAVIGFLGGVIGIAVSYVSSDILNFIQASQGGGGEMYGPQTTGLSKSIIPLWLAFSAVGFSTIMGVLAGLLPAFRATKLSALEAIKNE